MSFAEKYRKSREEEYKALDHRSFLDRLEAETKEDFKSFKSVGAEIAKLQTEFIGHLHKVAEMFDNKTFTPGVAAAAGFGAAAIAAGVVATVVGVGLIPATLGFSVAAVGVGIGSIAGGIAVAAGGVGLSSLPPIVKKLKKRLEIKKAQASYDKAIKVVVRLYVMYEQIMEKIKGDDIPNNCSIDLLFAHLAGVHMHGVKDKGDKLCSAAENLAIYHKIRKQAEEQIESSKHILINSKFYSVSKISPNFAFPVGFNLVEGGSVDVVYTVRTQVTRLPIATEEADMRILRAMCIATLQKERDTIVALCNL
jgi:hypothetical protein